ncbi:hypothetical protein D2Q93_01125 [Alicyclobacillaceae bacterium I2511]|nr:hypothetical protein D2Q93_01125 [Alicyclobacillaceae bacterium I2511]
MISFWLMLAVLDLAATFSFGLTFHMIFRRIWVAPSLYALLNAFLWIRIGHFMIVAEWVLLILGWLGTGLSMWAGGSLKKMGQVLLS